MANVTATVTQLSSSITTTTVSTTFTTSVSSTSTQTATPTAVLGGFDALEFGDQTMWMFYTDQNKNIKHLQASADTYYTRTNWAPGYPGTIASGVKPGSSVQVIGTRNLTTSTRSDVS